MHFRHELAHATTPDKVFEMTADPASRQRVRKALVVVSHDVSLARTDEASDAATSASLAGVR